MVDPTFLIPDSLKQRFVDGLVEFIAGRAEQLGSDHVAQSIRKLSSEAAFRASADRAFETGVGRFVDEYREQDEDLVDAIVGDTVFWQSSEVQQALLEMVQRPGAWMPGDSDTVVRHFEWVLPQRVNRQRVDKAVSYLLGCIARELWSLPGAGEVRDVYALQFQKLTAEAAREQVALAQKQLAATAQLSGDIRQALLQLTAAMEKTLLTPPAVPALVASPKPYNNLPQPTYVHFVGRDAELAWLRERLSPADRAWQIAINGIGGVGKTALALTVADEYRRRYHELPMEERFEAIIWVSAKEEVLTAQGRERADLSEAILHTLEDVYTAISRVLEREDITRALPEDQNALVQKALQRQRTLLVMDNMESVEDDRIKAFLRKLPAPTKAIITSREWIDVADVWVLNGLSREDAETLIEEEATTRGVALNARQRGRLYDLTAGLPLPLKLGIARMSAGESFAAVERWLGDATGDLPEYCVQGQADLVRTRDPNAWTVLLACSLFDREAGASREALGEIANLSLADGDRALAHLQKLFLVNRSDNDRFWVLPIVQRYASPELSGNEIASHIVTAWIDWLVRFSQEYGPRVEHDLNVSHRVMLEYPNVRIGILSCVEREAWSSLVSLAGTIWHYPYRMGLYSELEEIIERWLAAARATTDELEQGRAKLQLARLLWIWDRADESLAYLETAERILAAHDDRANLAEAWDTRSQIYRVRGMTEDAQLLVAHILQVGREINDLDVQIIGALGLATIESFKGNLLDAHGWLDLAERLAIELWSRRRLAGVHYRRSTVLVREGKLDQAEEILNQVTQTAAEMGDLRFIADTQRQLARVYALTGRYGLAREQAEEALTLFERLAMKYRLTEVHDFLNSLQEPENLPIGPIS